MSANRTSCEKVWPFDFVESFRCSISSVSIYYVPDSNICVKTYDHSNFLRASVVQFRASRWVMYENRTSVWKVMTIQISWVLPLCIIERLDILCPQIQTSVWKVMTIRILESFRCLISSASICDLPESDIRVKCNDNVYFSGASINQ